MKLRFTEFQNVKWRPCVAALGAALILNAAPISLVSSAEQTPVTEIKKYYAYVGERRIHYRRAGSGPPLVLLHASPGSSYGLESITRALAGQHTVIAIDTPGYGESTALGLEQPEIDDYAAALTKTLDALNLDRVDLYGSHTGAAIALDFAYQEPTRVRRLVLDGVPIYSPEETVDRLANYTPSLAPVSDGTHLIRGWAMRRNMFIFSPWYDHSVQARRIAEIPSALEFQGMMVDFLRAGPDYYKGYGAAFRYQSLEILPHVTVPTLLDALPSDSLREHIERSKDRPPNVTIGEASPDSTDPEGDLVERILGFLAGDALPDAPPPAPVVPEPGVIRRDYVDTSVGQLLVRRSGVGDGRPFVLLHASPSSSAGLEPLVAAMGEDRPVVTFDNPGNGDSAALAGVPEIWDSAVILGEGIDALGFEEYDLYGTHTGALLAMEVAIARPQQVHRLILDGVTLFTESETADYLANYVRPLQVGDDGGHLIWAWNFLRDQALWWPWYNRTVSGSRISGAASPERLHASYVEFIKGGTTYHLNYRAAFAYPTRDRLPLIKTPTLVGTTATDVLRLGNEEAGQLLPNSELALFPGRATPEQIAATVRQFAEFVAD